MNYLYTMHAIRFSERGTLTRNEWIHDKDQAHLSKKALCRSLVVSAGTNRNVTATMAARSFICWNVDHRYPKAMSLLLSTLISPSTVTISTLSITSPVSYAMPPKNRDENKVKHGRSQCQINEFTCPPAPAFMKTAPPTVPGMPPANSRPENPSMEQRTPRRLNGYPLPTR